MLAAILDIASQSSGKGHETATGQTQTDTNNEIQPRVCAGGFEAQLAHCNGAKHSRHHRQNRNFNPIYWLGRLVTQALADVGGMVGSFDSLPKVKHQDVVDQRQSYPVCVLYKI
jgi:hypothetical protein